MLTTPWVIDSINSLNDTTHPDGADDMKKYTIKSADESDEFNATQTAACRFVYSILFVASAIITAALIAAHL